MHLCSGSSRSLPTRFLAACELVASARKKAMVPQANPASASHFLSPHVEEPTSDTMSLKPS